LIHTTRFKVIKIPLTAALKVHVQILNLLLDKGFIEFGAGRRAKTTARTISALKDGDFWNVLTMLPKTKTPTNIEFAGV
jgi:hypothetical protein